MRMIIWLAYSIAAVLPGLFAQEHIRYTLHTNKFRIHTHTDARRAKCL